MRNMRSSRKITKMSSMKEIFLVLNSSEEMMSSLFFMRRLRFYNQLLLRVRSNIKRDSKILDYLNSRLLISNLN